MAPWRLAGVRAATLRRHGVGFKSLHEALDTTTTTTTGGLPAHPVPVMTAARVDAAHYRVHRGVMGDSGRADQPGPIRAKKISVGPFLACGAAKVKIAAKPRPPSAASPWYSPT